MNGKYITLPDGVQVWICNECLKGTHMSYGFDHRTGEVDRRDCKNLGGKGGQCGCNPDWPELMFEIEKQR